MVALLPAILILDSEICTYVLLPILCVTLLVSLIRNHVMMLMYSPTKPEFKAVYESQILLRSRRLRANGSKIPLRAFEIRKSFFSHKTEGILTKKSQKKTEQVDPLTGMQNNMMASGAMKGMMKGQVNMLVSNIYIIGLYQTIDHFFSGFLAAKLPFTLTRGFKGMFQQSLDLPVLEVSYVSSSSWYLLIFSGMREVTSVLFGPQAIAGLTLPQADMMMPAQQPSMFADPTKNYVMELENLQLASHDWVCEGTFKRLQRNPV